MLRIKLRYVFLIFLAVSFFFSFSSAQAQEGGVVVFSKLIEGSLPGDDPWSAQWEQAPAVEFPMSAQVHWEPRLFMASVNSVKVRSLHNGTELAILLEYQDPEQNPTDAAAIEFPVGEDKAHFAHGQPMLQVEGGPVNIWYWKADQILDMNAKGFGTLKVQAQQDVKGKGVWKNGVWRITFTRKLQSGDEKDVQIVPGEFKQIAFAIWEGTKGEQGSRKNITSWWYFRAEPPPDRSVWVYTLAAIAGAVVFEIVLVRRMKKKVK
ncbi:MAG: ethylbenzene dehydrogenase-related protein [Nitrospira sp.]|nr:ethylbenzene dehydrogenase-related protein [Nitrospira sp.]